MASEKIPDSSPWLRAWVRGAIEGLTSKPEAPDNFLKLTDRPTVADLALHARIIARSQRWQANEAEAWCVRHSRCSLAPDPDPAVAIEHKIFRHVPPGGVTDLWTCVCGAVLEQRAPLMSHP